MTNEIRKNSYINLIVGAAILAVVAVYAFSPIDVVPDFFVGLGQIDDGIVIMNIWDFLMNPESLSL